MLHMQPEHLDDDLVSMLYTANERIEHVNSNVAHSSGNGCLRSTQVIAAIIAAHEVKHSVLTTVVKAKAKGGL